MNSRRMFPRIVVAFAALILLSLTARAKGQAPGSDAAPGIETETEYTYAAVTLDGQPVFRVRGIASYSAARRAQAISERIAALAADRSVSLDSLKTIDDPGLSRVVAGNQPVVTVLDQQATAERVSRYALAIAFNRRSQSGSVPIAGIAVRAR